VERTVLDQTRRLDFEAVSTTKAVGGQQAGNATEWDKPNYDAFYTYCRSDKFKDFSEMVEVFELVIPFGPPGKPQPTGGAANEDLENLEILTESRLGAQAPSVAGKLEHRLTMSADGIDQVCNAALRSGNDKMFAVAAKHLPKPSTLDTGLTWTDDVWGNAKDFDTLVAYCQSEALVASVREKLETRLAVHLEQMNSSDIYMFDAYCRKELVQSEDELNQMLAITKAKLGQSDNPGAFRGTISEQRLCNAVRDEASARSTAWWVTVVSVVGVLMLLGLVGVFLFGRKKGVRPEAKRSARRGGTMSRPQRSGQFQSASARPTLTGARRGSARSSVPSRPSLDIYPHA
jgi:hypothetical protein